MLNYVCMPNYCRPRFAAQQMSYVAAHGAVSSMLLAPNGVVQNVQPITTGAPCMSCARMFGMP